MRHHNGGHMLVQRSCSTCTPQLSSDPGGIEQRQLYRVPLRGALSFCLVAALLVMALPAWTQQVTGSIVGTVTDPTGAAVNGATVTVRDVDRGTALTTRTNDTGAFDFPSVPAGSYQVTVQAQG